MRPATQKPRKGSILRSEPHWSKKKFDGIWIFNERGGNLIQDSSSNGSLGTNNGAAWVIDVDGPVLSFNGSSDSVDFGEVADNDGTQPFSVVIQAIKPNTTEDYLISKQSNTSPFPGWSVSQSDRIFFQLRFQNDDRILVSTAASSIAANTKYRIIATYDGSKAASGVNISIDGLVSTPSILADTLTGSSTTTAQLSIGSRDSVTQFWDGKIGGATIYPFALIPAQVRSLHQEPYQMFQDEVVWRFGKAPVVGGINLFRRRIDGD